MSITVKKNKRHNLKLPKFLVDYVLKDNVVEPFNYLVSGFQEILITGNAGTGKTSLLIGLLTDKKALKRCWNHIIVVMPQTSRRSMKKDIFADLDPSKQFEDLSRVDLIYDMIRHHSDNEESTLIILDDQQSFLKDHHTAQVINHIASNRRHLRCTLIILLQTYNQIALKSRKLTNVLIAFKPSKKEWTNISEELIEYDEKTKEQLYKMMFPHGEDNKHRWMLLDVASQRVYKEFDELVVTDN